MKHAAELKRMAGSRSKKFSDPVFALKEVDAWALRKMDVHPILIRQYTRVFGIEHEKIFTHSPHFPSNMNT